MDNLVDYQLREQYPGRHGAWLRSRVPRWRNQNVPARGEGLCVPMECSNKHGNDDY